MISEQAATEIVIQVGPSATLVSMDEIHHAITDALATNSVLLDLGGIEETDVSFVQLLLAADAAARLDGKTVALSAPANNVVRAVLERGGFLADADSRRFWLGETG
jgi:anti-anti-sigma regulatory factor